MNRRDTRSMEDQEILSRLNRMGIETTIEEFREKAMAAGSPTALASQWLRAFDVKEEKGDFLYEAAFVLWKRHLKDVQCPELLAEYIDETVSSYLSRPDEHDRESIRDIYERIRYFYQQLILPDGRPDVDLYNRLTLLEYTDVEGFLLGFPFEMARYGFIDEAVSIEKWFSGLSSQPQNFLRDMGCILADAGMKEEALRQIEINLRRFPDDIWVVINAGDAMDSLGDTESAERYFQKAYSMAGNKKDRAAVLERMIDLYRDLGMKEKADSCDREYRMLEESEGL